MVDTMKAMNDARRLYFGTGVKRRVAGLENLEGLEDADLDAELKKRGLTRDDLYEIDGPSLANLDLEDLPEKYQEFKPLIRELVDRGAANASTVVDELRVRLANVYRDSDLKKPEPLGYRVRGTNHET